MDLPGVGDLTDTRIWAEQQGFKFVETSAATSEGVQDIFSLVVSANSKVNRGPVEKNFTNDQIEAVKKIRAAKDNYERLGLMPGNFRAKICIISLRLILDRLVYSSSKNKFAPFSSLSIQILLKFIIWPLGSTRDQINKQYKKMAILLHPDKSLAPGAEEAFKAGVQISSFFTYSTRSN